MYHSWENWEESHSGNFFVLCSSDEEPGLRKAGGIWKAYISSDLLWFVNMVVSRPSREICLEMDFRQVILPGYHGPEYHWHFASLSCPSRVNERLLHSLTHCTPRWTSWLVKFWFQGLCIPWLWNKEATKWELFKGQQRWRSCISLYKAFVESLSLPGKDWSRETLWENWTCFIGWCQSAAFLFPGWAHMDHLGADLTHPLEFS